MLNLHRVKRGIDSWHTTPEKRKRAERHAYKVCMHCALRRLFWNEDVDPSCQLLQPRHTQHNVFPADVASDDNNDASTQRKPQDRVGRERIAIGRVRPSYSFHANFRTNWPSTLDILHVCGPCPIARWRLKTKVSRSNRKSRVIVGFRVEPWIEGSLFSCLYRIWPLVLRASIQITVILPPGRTWSFITMSMSVCKYMSKPDLRQILGACDRGLVLLW